MNNGKTIGMALFVGGLILLIIYGLILGLDEILASLDIISGFLIGIILIGLLTLLISIIFEQRTNTKKTLNEINKEDLKP
jgi:uncharacterized membrane protein (DUF106 family)